MFKKPLGNLKTSAPLRSSDRKKLKQRAVAAYGLSSEEGDVLVPDGILSVKFSTHVDEPGVAYLDVEGNPLWFTIGKGASEDLIPTIYTLWKKQDLLPSVSTPSAVIPILIGGADLMIPGVMHCSPSLKEKQLVSIRQYVKKDGKPFLSPPLAVGRMALPSDQLKSAKQEKGKAVLVAHTWKDHLWEMGSKGDVPEDTTLDNSSSDEEDGSSEEEEDDDDQAIAPRPSTDPGTSSAVVPGASTAPSLVTYSPQEVTELLNKALLQAIAKVLQSLPSSSFPISATILYTNHILPNRPAFPTLILPPAGVSLDPAQETPRVETDITIKSSSHKSLTTFLKAAEKSGLLTLKPPQKQQPDILVTAVNASHPSVQSHKSFATFKDVELTAAKKAAREEKQKEKQAWSGELEVRELCKPHQSTVDLFEGLGGSKNDLYTPAQVREMLITYITTHNLINQRDKAYINLDDLLFKCVDSKGNTKAKGKDAEAEAEATSKFMRRDELVKNVLERMQSWYEIRADGHDVVTKKGTLAPIQVVTKVRQGRKACTLITGFEPFLVIDAEEMAEELRKTCAGATSVSPAPGKPPGNLEVLIQGKQSKAVVDYLLAKGIPKKWIEIADLSGKK